MGRRVRIAPCQSLRATGTPLGVSLHLPFHHSWLFFIATGIQENQNVIILKGRWSTKPSQPIQRQCSVSLKSLIYYKVRRRLRAFRRQKTPTDSLIFWLSDRGREMNVAFLSLCLVCPGHYKDWTSCSKMTRWEPSQSGHHQWNFEVRFSIVQSSHSLATSK